MDIITPELRRLLVTAVHEFREKAEQTPNPYDDLLADLLFQLFMISYKEED